MPDLMNISDLKAGDVLLYHGTSLVSKLIRLFDGGVYNHVSIYDGSNVAEAVKNGVVSRPVSESIKEARYVDVFRFQSDTGQGLGEGEELIKDQISRYVAEGERYAYEQIILLAFIAVTRRLPFIKLIPLLGKILRNIIDSAAYLLNEIIAAGKEPMICSELVYRCYADAGEDYKLSIVGADLLRQNSLLDPLDGSDFEVQQTAAAAQEFLQLLEVACRNESRLRAVPDFVTPRDIRTSPNLIRQGCLK